VQSVVEGWRRVCERGHCSVLMSMVDVGVVVVVLRNLTMNGTVLSAFSCVEVCGRMKKGLRRYGL
jgi:hypothetical protein